AIPARQARPPERRTAPGAAMASASLSLRLALRGHRQHRLHERRRDALAAERGEMHAIERQVRVGEVDDIAEVDVAKTRIAVECTIEHRGHFRLLLAMALTEIGAGAVRLRRDDHLVAM